MNNFKVSKNLSWRDFLIRTALVIVSVTIIVAVLPRDHGVSFNIEKGRPWRYSDVTAPFDFPIYKSDEVIKEENVPDEDKEALKYKSKGEFRYSSAPDTYVRVNVVNIPVIRKQLGIK